jgi:hypothetical protein
MERKFRHMRIGLAALAAVVFAGAIAGCGDDGDYKNNPRPPRPIVLTASISDKAINVSPAHFGAGPVSLIITNLTRAPQQITFRSDEGGAGAFEQSTGPINPGDAATVKADVPEGSATVKVAAREIKAAVVSVGPQRKSSQDELLLP